MMARQISFSGGEKRIAVAQHKECICERPHTDVFCRHCTLLIRNSRVRSVCGVHPQTFYLLDIDTCPQCKSTGKLQEVHPYNPSELDDMAQEDSHAPSDPQDSDFTEHMADASKNFYKRTLPVLATLPADTKRGGKAAYRYSHHNSRNLRRK